MEDSKGTVQQSHRLCPHRHWAAVGDLDKGVSGGRCGRALQPQGYARRGPVFFELIKGPLTLGTNAQTEITLTKTRTEVTNKAEELFSPSF